MPLEHPRLQPPERAALHQVKEDIMRAARLVLLVLAAAAPATARAQTPPAEPAGQKPAAEAAPQPEPPAEESNTGWIGSLDFGVRGTSVTGDAARYERYRDLGDGVFLEHVSAAREARGWLVDFRGEHVGRRDQRFAASAVDPGRFRAGFLWDQIPMLLSRTTRSLHTGIGSGVLSIDDALQQQVQTTPSAIAAVFNDAGRQFDTRTRRHLADGAVEYEVNQALTISSRVRQTMRDGTIPFGGSFGHSSLVEIPAPTDHRLTDVDTSAEYVRGPYLVRGGWTGSWFHNDVTSLVFDNPFRATDIPATPSRGRLTLPASNSLVSVNGLASVALPRRSRILAYASLGMLEDAGDTLVPQTINSSTSTGPLDRQTVNGEARIASFTVRFTSRPHRLTDVNVSYRGYDYDNRTPEFAMTERVAYDNTPAAVSPAIHTEPYSVGRGTLDAELRIVPTGRTWAGIGYTRTGEDRTHRIFESTTDNTVRLTFDTVSRQWFALRTKYEHAQRRGEGIEQGEALLASIGEQPQLRHFDIANRDRDRVTVIGSITPLAALTASLSLAAGKDDYIESVFGLRDNTHRVYSAGADYLPVDRVSLGLSYSYERYNALQRSRQANPGVQFTDPSRNWAADSTDLVHSVLLNADVARIGGRTDLRLSYDYSRGRARYTYITGPVTDRTLPEEVPVPTSLPTPTELPPTLSEFHRGTADVVHALTSRVAIGASYWYDQYRVSDFTLDVDANPELARGQALLMGYLYRPYRANTGWVRLIYRW
jgi:MtrB/PioB family decaheme-associated outer membrane protein